MSFIERHITSLRLAQQCMELGARRRTVSIITGLSDKQLMTKFFFDRGDWPRGRSPDTAEWVFKANQPIRAEAAVFAGLLRSILEDKDRHPGEALVAAYKGYQSVCGGRARVPFDVAFGLARDLHGLWTRTPPRISLEPCKHCGLDSIEQRGAPRVNCPFCALLYRYRYDRRLWRIYPPAASFEPTPAVRRLGQQRQGCPNNPQKSPIEAFDSA